MVWLFVVFFEGLYLVASGMMITSSASIRNLVRRETCEEGEEGRRGRRVMRGGRVRRVRRETMARLSMSSSSCLLHRKNTRSLQWENFCLGRGALRYEGEVEGEGEGEVKVRVKIKMKVR